jgi:hypothetical protein
MAFAGSSTTLGNAGVWDSGNKETLDNDSLQGTVFADQGGTLLIKQSLDGTNYDKVTTLTIVANTPQDINVTLLCPYWRMVYTNGATPQGAFRVGARTTSAGDS